MISERLILITGLVLAGVCAASASFHEMQIEQIIGGVNGDTSAQAIQLRVRAAGGNTLNGIETASGVTVSGCTVKNNGANGISLGSDSTMMECTSSLNASNGIAIPNNSLVRNNTCTRNGRAGILIPTTVTGNRLDENNVVANSRGIEVLNANNLIIRNSAIGNPPTGAAGSSNYVFTVTPVFGPTNAVSGVVTNHPWGNFNF